MELPDVSSAEGPITPHSCPEKLSFTFWAKDSPAAHEQTDQIALEELFHPLKQRQEELKKVKVLSFCLPDEGS